MASNSVPEEHRRLHALLVEDDLTTRMIVKRLLEDSRWTAIYRNPHVVDVIAPVVLTSVTVADDGQNALQYLGLEGEDATGSEDVKKNLDMVITDFSIPIVDGYELLKKIKHDSSIFKEIPVVVMSGYEDKTLIDRCMEAGAKNFLKKPVQMDAIRSLEGMVHNHS